MRSGCEGECESEQESKLESENSILIFSYMKSQTVLRQNSDFGNKSLVGLLVGQLVGQLVCRQLTDSQTDSL